MSTKKEIWRLLEPGVDMWQEGDEIENHVVQWEAVPSTWIGFIVRRDAPVSRRRMTLPEPQGWISVKERMPTKEDANKEGNVLWFRSDGGRICPQISGWDKFGEWFTHWMSFPDDPVPADPDEEAWQQFLIASHVRNWGRVFMESAKEGFLAGRKSVMTEKEGEA